MIMKPGNYRQSVWHHLRGLNCKVSGLSDDDRLALRSVKERVLSLARVITTIAEKRADRIVIDVPHIGVGIELEKKAGGQSTVSGYKKKLQNTRRRAEECTVETQMVMARIQASFCVGCLKECFSYI